MYSNALSTNFQSIFDKVILNQAMNMTGDHSHVLQPEFELLPSVRPLCTPMSRYNRYKNSCSFGYKAVKL